MNLNKKLLVGISMLFAVTAFGNAGYKQSASVMPNSKAVPHLTIRFEPGSSVIPDADKMKLRTLITETRDKENVTGVTVAAWSDKAFPMKDAKLLESDRELAANRAQAVESFLTSQLDISDVDTYNMAENSNWLARTMNTKDAELKSIFSKKGEAAPVTDAEFRVIRNVGSPMEAVVVVERSEYSK